MAVEGPHPLTVLTPPHGQHLVLTGSEEEVTVVVVLDDRDGPFVALKQVGTLLCLFVLCCVVLCSGVLCGVVRERKVQQQDIAIS